MASSGKLNLDRRKWHFSRNHFFPEEIWERYSHHTNFSFRKTSQSSPSISDLSLELHNSNSNLFGWAVRGRLVVPHSFFESCSKLEFAHYTHYTIEYFPYSMWYPHVILSLIINVCTAPCGKGIVQTASWCLSSSLLEGFFIHSWTWWKVNAPGEKKTQMQILSNQGVFKHWETSQQ